MQDDPPFLGAVADAIPCGAILKASWYNRKSSRHHESLLRQSGGILGSSFVLVGHLGAISVNLGSSLGHARASLKPSWAI